MDNQSFNCLLTSLNCRVILSFAHKKLLCAEMEKHVLKHDFFVML